MPNELTPEEVAELIRAKQEGRLIELPCKLGDTVYRIDPDEDKIQETKCFSLSVNETICRGKHVEWLIWLYVSVNGRSQSELYGRTIFLTRGQAEAALKGSEQE